eukprot:365199-Chlamydomonas_euryale.AAC.2
MASRRLLCCCLWNTERERCHGQPRGCSRALRAQKAETIPGDARPAAARGWQQRVARQGTACTSPPERVHVFRGRPSMGSAVQLRIRRRMITHDPAYASRGGGGPRVDTTPGWRLSLEWTRPQGGGFSWGGRDHNLATR